MDEKRELKRRYKRLHQQVVRILYRHDPIGIGIEIDGPLDEYEPEAGSILPPRKRPSMWRRPVFDWFPLWV